MILLALSLALWPSLVYPYTWPNPQLDELESQLYDRIGYNAHKLSQSVVPCNRFDFGVGGGRSNAADWVRTAYHDMAPFNSADGTGGLDASIRFELDVPENVGNGFGNTIKTVNSQANRYVSVADEIALATVIAVEECGGPKVDFRGGRVDAKTANTPGVPRPQDPLDTHIASFARQGFNQTEMISLVACGHTLGGVQHVSFPDIVPPSTNPQNSQGQVLFDTTGSQFDNKIIHEYLDGTTLDPLIVAQNDTFNSDKRIFGSDGNATMNRHGIFEKLTTHAPAHIIHLCNSLSDAQVFANTCATLFSKMLDSVPKGVQLTEVIEPLPVKPHSMYLVHSSNNTVELSGQVRFWNMKENPNRVVKVRWADQTGQACSNCSMVLTHWPNQVSTYTVGSITALWYSFLPSTSPNRPSTSIVFDDKQTVSKVWFEVDEGDGKPVVRDQDGAGFAVQDRRLMLSNHTCMGYPNNVTIAAAVLKGSAPKRVYIKADDVSEMNGTAISLNAVPITRTFDIPAPGADKTPVNGSYEIWTLSMAFNDWPNGPFNVAADFADGTVETPFLTSFQYPSCIVTRVQSQSPEGNDAKKDGISARSLLLSVVFAALSLVVFL